VEVCGQIRALAALPPGERNHSRSLDWAPEPVYILEKKKNSLIKTYAKWKDIPNRSIGFCDENMG
jgi:hypothetical protein